MRFLLSLLLILVTALPAAASARVVRVGIYDNPPKIFMSETGQASGILVDLLASVASKSGWSWSMWLASGRNASKPCARETSI